MTSKQMAVVAGCSRWAITRMGRKLFPDKFSRTGIITIYTEQEANLIMQNVIKRNFVSPKKSIPPLPKVQNAQVPGSKIETLMEMMLEIVRDTRYRVAKLEGHHMTTSTNKQLWWMKYFDDLRLKCLI